MIVVDRRVLHLLAGIKCAGFIGWMLFLVLLSAAPVRADSVVPTAISGGVFHTCALMNDETVRCWGDNSNGQLGDGTTTNRSSPINVNGLSGVKKVSSGDYHTCVLLNNGTVMCWGKNTEGQLGDVTYTSRTSPVSVIGLSSVTAISAGHLHTCALLADGTVYCWGHNYNGQLGDGGSDLTSDNRSYPVRVSGLANEIVTAIEVGSDHSCALLADGTVRCWGYNYQGQLGDGTYFKRRSAVNVTGLSGVGAISSGGYHTCSFLTNGTAKCWGENNYGQLGDGTQVRRYSPVNSPMLSGALAHSAGDENTCALLADRTVKCWGNNNYGQLGNGTTTYSLSPVSVTGLSDVKEISAKTYHACALLTDGPIKCWGSNIHGELGDGTQINKSSPTTVRFLQTITWSQSLTGAVGGSITLTAVKGASTSPVVYVSTTTGVCSVSGSTLSLLTAGSCTVKATQATDANYNAAADVPQTFTVDKGSQTINFTSTAPSATVGGSTYSPTAAGGASGNPVVLSVDAISSLICSISSGEVNFAAAGSCVINASQAGNDNYDAATQIQQIVTVGQGSQTITWTQVLSGTPGDTVTLTASASSGLAVSYASSTIGTCTVSGSTLSLIAAGTCTVTATQSGNDNYSAATQIPQSFVVTIGSQTITWSQALSGAVGRTLALTATASSGLPITYASSTPSVCTVVGSNLSLVKLGVCNVIAAQEGSSNYSAAASVPKTFTVTNGLQTIKWTQKLSGSYANVLALTASASSGLPVTYTSSTIAVCTVSGSTLNLIAAGSCKVVATQSGDVNYNAAKPITKTVKVKKAIQTITWTQDLSVAVGTQLALAANASSGLPVSYTSRPTKTCKVTGTTLEIFGLGTCAVTSSQKGNLNFNAAKPVTRAVSIVAATVSAFAGNVDGPGFADGTGSEARFSEPLGLAVEANGDLYVADSNNNVIRKITPDGVVSTLAGSPLLPGSVDGVARVARFSSPSGLTIAGGTILVGDEHGMVARKIDQFGLVTTIGRAPQSVAPLDGDAKSEGAEGVQQTVLDRAGNAYVSDESDGVIRRVSKTGAVTVFAGSVGVKGSSDGVGSDASFYAPLGIALGVDSTVYIADPVANTIRKITSDGSVTTLAGISAVVGANDDMGSAATFSQPSGIVADTSGNLFVSDTDNNTIRKIASNGVVTTFAGSASFAGSLDGNGIAARLNKPTGMAVDVVGNIYVADSGNHTIRKITPEGIVTTIAGTTGVAGSIDGTGLSALFRSPSALAVTTTGLLYIADTENFTIRKMVLSTGRVTTVAGRAGEEGSANGSVGGARLGYIHGIALDSAGNVIVADFTYNTVRKITASGSVTTFAGVANVRGNENGIGASSRFSGPRNIMVDREDNIYVSDYANCLLRRISSTAEVTTIAGTPGLCKFVSGSAPSSINAPMGLVKYGNTLFFVAGNGVAQVANVP